MQWDISLSSQPSRMNNVNDALSRILEKNMSTSVGDNAAAIKLERLPPVSCPVAEETRLPFNRRRTTREYVYLVTLVWLFLLLWPWPSPNDLDIRNKLGYSEDIPAYQKNEISRSRLSSVRDRHGNTDRQMRPDALLLRIRWCQWRRRLRFVARRFLATKTAATSPEYLH